MSKAIVSLVSKNPHDTSRIADNVLAFIHRHGLDTQLPSILLALKRESVVHAHRETLSIQVSHPVSNTDVEHIQKFVGATAPAHIQVSQDARLIGGFMAYWKDRKIDATILYSLERLRESLQK